MRCRDPLLLKTYWVLSLFLSFFLQDMQVVWYGNRSVGRKESNRMSRCYPQAWQNNQKHLICVGHLRLMQQVLELGAQSHYWIGQDSFLLGWRKTQWRRRWFLSQDLEEEGNQGTNGLSAVTRVFQVSCVSFKVDVDHSENSLANQWSILRNWILSKWSVRV